MALKATIFRATLQIADIDRGYYRDHSLTLALHPSETEERMMVRLLAFALHADDALAFGRGLSAEDEPDLLRKDLTGAIDLWIDVGQPDERDIRKACGRARKVCVYSYGGLDAGKWWDSAAVRLARHDNLVVKHIPTPMCMALARLARRNMQLQCTVEDGQIWLADDDTRVEINLVPLKILSEESR